LSRVIVMIRTRGPVQPKKSEFSAEFVWKRNDYDDFNEKDSGTAWNDPITEGVRRASLRGSRRLFQDERIEPRSDPPEH
jgi:hypothetical protein